MPEYTFLQQKLCGKLISQFDAISVREHGGIKAIHNFNWMVKNECVVLDPTMLLISNDYVKLLPSSYSASFGKIFCYVLDDEDAIELLINQTCSLLKKERFDILNNLNKDFNIALPSVEKWLCGIRDADYIITDSFHGVVFSIIFNKPFLVFVNKIRGTDRFKSLLGDLNLEYLMVDNLDKIQYACSKSINWEEINEKVKSMKIYSLSFLVKSLSGESVL